MKRRNFYIKKKKYQNPFFNKKRSYYNFKFNLNSWKNKLFIIIIIFLILAFFYFILSSSFFQIKEINISGNIKYSTEELEKISQAQFQKNRYIFFKQSNIFLFNSKSFQKILSDRLAVDEVLISKKFFKTLNIKIKEKSYSFVWQEGDSYYYADFDGYIIREANPIEINIKETPVFFNANESKISYNKIKIEYDYIPYAVEISQRLQKNNFSVKKIIISEKFNTLEAELENGPLVYFNIEDELDKQIENLIIIKEDKLKDDFNQKSYIDLRYKGRIYYQ